jgi:hypothetical protein
MQAQLLLTRVGKKVLNGLKFRAPADCGCLGLAMPAAVSQPPLTVLMAYVPAVVLLDLRATPITMVAVVTCQKP